MASEIRVNSLTNRSGLSTVSITDTGAVVAGIVTATTFSGPLTGAVTGNVTGDLTGNVTGNVTGNLTGDVTGNTSGTAGGLTGSPNITVTDITATGNVSIGGTLTYEDVTNIDSVGIITAQSDVLVGRNLSVTSGISTVKSLDYAAIDSTISDTARDIFIYDTSKDSDGGAWRKRTQHTSWYNETLNTSTRGSRREFPAVAVIVGNAGNITIYDGDDPDLPMWMVFNTNEDSYSTNYMIWGTYNVVMKNGWLYSGSPQGESWENVITRVNFISEQSNLITSSGLWYGKKSIADRNTANLPGASSGSYDTSSITIVANSVNDVAITVLPNAPIDDATGLPVPTIAVATNAGVSIIKDDGSVVDHIDSAGGESTQVTFTQDGKLAHSHDGHTGIRIDSLKSSDFTYGSNKVAKHNSEEFYINYGLTLSGWSGNTPRLNTGSFNSGGQIVPVQDNILAERADTGLNLLARDFPGSPNDNRVAYATTSYNTGWMHGDIKGAFLSDTDTTNITGSELVTNGTFASDVSGWTAVNGTITYSSGTAVVNRTGGSGPVAYQTITTVVGETYVLSGTVDSTGTGDRGDIRAYSDNASTMLVNASGTDNQTVNVSGTFTATTTTTYIYFVLDNTGTATFDNVSVRIAELDRSRHNKGLQVFGTITKSAVATGADLVSYGGYTTSNYLKQPYNSGLDFGTGDFSVTWWQYITGDIGSSQYVYDRQGANGNRHAVYYTNANSGSLAFYTNAGSSSEIIATGINYYKDGWACYTVSRRSSGLMQIYINGELKQSSTLAVRDLTNTSAELFIGIRHSVDTAAATQAKYALMRFSESIPSPEQIKKIYEDEKVLFQENAKATLYGSSDAVTALAFDDDTDLLHVGTSSGRSDFQGLRRINNTTTAVTTAITAQNEFIIEQ